MNLADITAIVLASGKSNRFGIENKLLAPLGGKPVAQHVAECISKAGFKKLLLVAPKGSFRLIKLFEAFEFRTVVNPLPEQGQGKSLAVGTKEALRDNPSGVMVCLADMPFIPTKIFSNLASVIGASNVAICGTSGGVMSPPVLFEAEAARQLQFLSGDIGARKIIDSLEYVTRLETPPNLLQDIDTPEDLAKAQARITAFA